MQAIAMLGKSIGIVFIDLLFLALLGLLLSGCAPAVPSSEKSVPAVPASEDRTVDVQMAQKP